jgi:hypothetical protein
MELFLFIDSIQEQKDDFLSKKVICLRGTQFPLLFFSPMANVLRKIFNTTPVFIDKGQWDWQTFEGQLATSFLGASYLYCLGSLDQFEKNETKKIIDYLIRYQGPNRIFFFTNYNLDKTELPSFWQQISIPDKIDMRSAVKIAQFLEFSIGSYEKRFMQSMALHVDQLPLDNVCMLLQYAPVVSSACHQSFVQWLPSIVMAQSSLFLLSQHFFALQPTAFFEQWQTISSLYGDQFWIAYWSEQLWRSYFFVYYARKSQWIEAKKIGYKLPFSFLQRDWKRYDLAYLQSAHEYLYSIDYRIKHGGGSYALELFYTKFLHKQLL